MITDMERVTDAVAELRRRVSLPGSALGPVPLASYFAETALDHVELPNLTCGSVADYLRREGVAVEDVGSPDDSLAGFVFTAGRVGWAFVALRTSSQGGDLRLPTNSAISFCTAQPWEGFGQIPTRLSKKRMAKWPTEWNGKQIDSRQSF